MQNRKQHIKTTEKIKVFVNEDNDEVTDSVCNKKTLEINVCDDVRSEDLNYYDICNE